VSAVSPGLVWGVRIGLSDWQSRKIMSTGLRARRAAVATPALPKKPGLRGIGCDASLYDGSLMGLVRAGAPASARWPS